MTTFTTANAPLEQMWLLIDTKSDSSDGSNTRIFLFLMGKSFEKHKHNHMNMT